ncbi:bacteriocin-like protein [Chryseobacterium takakiae]|uniref:Uncharacterized protein n=1 Tax=Chryseobacterium takakiae TaxID=1302685 RepID=A0A1M5BSY0_9FLAO|nr:hypothetical protein [Chryseobacterium takakiae]SHF45618.1 hypothetical protein SAMN05444408_12313 [Chryseobacterium takakiae]
MKNLKKLSRKELKDLKGGVLSFTNTIEAAGNCWVYERNTLQGNKDDYKGGGSGKCSNPPSGYHCKTYTAMGSC